jgi:hypothetical protein
MELDPALNLLRFTGLWPMREKKSWRSKAIRIRAALSQLVFIFIMILIIVNWWMIDTYTDDDYYINVAKNVVILLKEYTAFMFFYRKRKMIEQLISRCTGDVAKLFKNSFVRVGMYFNHFGFKICMPNL